MDLLCLLCVCNSFVDTPYFLRLYLVCPDDNEMIFHDIENAAAVVLSLFPGINPL
jgi:hypothetical protein